MKILGRNLNSTQKREIMYKILTGKSNPWNGYSKGQEKWDFNIFTKGVCGEVALVVWHEQGKAGENTISTLLVVVFRIIPKPEEEKKMID